MHTTLSRYLWFLISTTAVVTAICLAQFHKTTQVVIFHCPQNASCLEDNTKTYVRESDEDLIRLAWIFLGVVAVIDAWILSSANKNPKSKSKSRKQKTARRK
jgi:uncharacterized membrane protein